MKLRNSALAVLVWALSWQAACAQEGDAKSDVQLPMCAMTCFSKALETRLCAVSDQNCICTDKAFNTVITECVEANCTIREALTAQRYQHVECDAPVRNDTKVISYVGVSGGILALIFVVLRLLVRLPYFGGQFGWDDLVIIAAFIVSVPLTVFSPILANLGLGRDIWTVEFDDITEILKIYYYDELWYVSATALAKISILFFYLRLFTLPRFRHQVFIVMALCVAYNVAFVFAFIFQCKPLNFAWTRWDGEHSGSCVNVNAVGWAQSGVNMFLDILVISLPLPQIATLNLPLCKKIPLFLVFGLGFFLTICSVIRIKYLEQFANSKNITWDYVPIGYWSTIETHLGIMIACLPAIRALFIRIFPCEETRTETSQVRPSHGSGNNRNSNRFSHKSNHFMQLDEFAEEGRFNATQKLPPEDGYIPGQFNITPSLPPDDDDDNDDEGRPSPSYPTYTMHTPPPRSYYQRNAYNVTEALPPGEYHAR